MIVERGVAVPMRDGVVLRADVYRPGRRRAACPAVLSRTPYDRSLGLTPAGRARPRARRRGGLRARLPGRPRPVRLGRASSTPSRSEGPDGYDTRRVGRGPALVDGAVGMAGRSYTAATQWLAAAEQPPAPAGDRAGGRRQRLLPRLGLPGRRVPARLQPLLGPPDDRPQGPRVSSTSSTGTCRSPTRRCSSRARPARFYRDWLAHPTDDELLARALDQPTATSACEVPAFNVGGWYDIFLGGTLENFVAAAARRRIARRRAPARASLVGPWAHGSTYGPYPDHSFEEFGAGRRSRPRRSSSCASSASTCAASAAARTTSRRCGSSSWARTAGATRTTGRSRARARAALVPHAARERRSLSPEAPGRRAAGRVRLRPATTRRRRSAGPTSLPGRFLRTNSGPLDQRKLEERDDVLVYSSEPLERAARGDRAARRSSSTPRPARATRTSSASSATCGPTAARASSPRACCARASGRASSGRGSVEPGTAVRVPRSTSWPRATCSCPATASACSVTSSSFPRFDRNANTGSPARARRDGGPRARAADRLPRRRPAVAATASGRRSLKDVWRRSPAGGADAAATILTLYARA